MKTTPNKKNIITPEMLNGPMMEYKEWSENETKEFADFVATKKKQNIKNKKTSIKKF